MERRRKAARGASPGGLAGGASSPAEPTSAAGWLHIQALIDGGGQIMIGTVAPIRGAAVAHTGNKTLVMLRRRPGEAVPELLARLDAAIATAKSTDSRIDEINDASSDRRYEI